VFVCVVGVLPQGPAAAEAEVRAALEAAREDEVGRMEGLLRAAMDAEGGGLRAEDAVAEALEALAEEAGEGGEALRAALAALPRPSADVGLLEGGEGDALAAAIAEAESMLREDGEQEVDEAGGGAADAELRAQMERSLLMGGAEHEAMGRLLAELQQAVRGGPRGAEAGEDEEGEAQQLDESQLNPVQRRVRAVRACGRRAVRGPGPGRVPLAAMHRRRGAEAGFRARRAMLTHSGAVHSLPRCRRRPCGRTCLPARARSWPSCCAPRTWRGWRRSRGRARPRWWCRTSPRRCRRPRCGPAAPPGSPLPVTCASQPVPVGLPALLLTHPPVR
jgi:hypothetical protein